MKKFFKKFVSVFLVSVLFMLPMCVSANAEDTLSEGVYIGGVMISKSGYWRFDKYNCLVKSTKYFYDVAYDAQKGTLTLKETNIKTRPFEDYYAGIEHGLYAAIISIGDININLIGKNEIAVGHTLSDAYGIYNFSGNTVISGEGSLNFTVNNYKDAYCIYSMEEKSVEIKNTSVSVTMSGDDHRNVYGIFSYDTNIVNSKIEMNIESLITYSHDNYMVVGISNYHYLPTLRIENSDIDMNFKSFELAAGFNVYKTEIINSNVNINIDTATQEGYGISTYAFKCSSSNVNCNMKNCDKKLNMSAIAYNNASINNDSMQQISTGSLTAKITPEDTYYSSAYINFAKSVYNPLENNYGGYFKTENGLIKRVNGDENSNIIYDRELNRLYMKDAKLSQPMRALGSADIILSGENILDCPSTFAMYCDLNQKFYGDGSLTLISGTSCAIMCAEGVEFDDSVAVVASTSIDGSNPVEFKSEDAGYYKWIKIQPTKALPDEEKTEENQQPEESFFDKIINAIKEFFKKIERFLDRYI